MGQTVNSGLTTAQINGSISTIPTALTAVGISQSGAGTTTLTVPANREWRVFSYAINSLYSSGTFTGTLVVNGVTWASIPSITTTVRSQYFALNTGGYVTLTAGQTITMTNDAAGGWCSAVLFYQNVVV